jgi:NAD+ diphosphatase
VPVLPYALPREPALSRAEVDRAASLRTDESALQQAWRDERSLALVVTAAGVPAVDGRLSLLPTADAPPGERYLLGVGADGGTVFAVRPEHDPVPADAAVRPIATVQSLRDVGAALPAREAGLVVHAVALANWHRTHPRCPRCGAPTVVVQGGHARRCPQDGSLHFPRTDPAMIVLLVDDTAPALPSSSDRCLLARQAAWPPGRFSTLAGFVEPGESFERCVVREVAEEVGLVAWDVQYAGSQPWPFPASLMLGAYARACGDPQVDGVEITQSRWFSRAALLEALEDGSVVLPPPVSIARLLIEGWYGAALPGDGVWR